nr:kinesin-related protein 4-like [Maniola hyperantus]
MTKRYLQILSVTAIFAVNGIKSDDSIKTLRKILKELKAPTEDRYDEANHDSNIVYLPSHYRHAHAKFKHGKSVPNLMNIQTMNLFLKSKRQRDEADQRFLRSDAENTCTAPGRCGCSGGRCGKKREDDLADEVDRVVNEINKQLPRDDDEIRNDRDIVTLDDRNWDIDENDQQRNRDDEDRIKNNDRYYDDGDEIKHDRDSDERDRRLVDSKNRVDRDELFNSKRIKINDNLDVVILDKSDLDVLLRNERFPDLTRKDVDKDDEDKEMVEFKKNVNVEDKASDRSTNDITPEEFFGYYEPMKQKLVAKAFNFRIAKY